MKKLASALIICLITALPLRAEGLETDIIVAGENVALEEYRWTNRPLVVFADSPNDPRFVQQMEYINDQIEALALRDVIVLTDTDPSARGPLRQDLRPHGFMLVLVDKNGNIALRKPSPWDVREISRSIDKMPLRQQEIREETRGN